MSVPDRPPSPRLIAMRALAARMARLSIREAIACPLPDRVDRARRDLCTLTNASGLRTTAELAALAGVTEAEVMRVVGPMTKEEEAIVAEVERA